MPVMLIFIFLNIYLTLAVKYYKTHKNNNEKRNDKYLDINIKLSLFCSRFYFIIALSSGQTMLELY